MAGMNYFANHVGAPQILQGTPNYNVELGEGINPPGDFYPAFYLQTVVSENRIGGSYYVLMPGKVIAFDSARRLIGAGLAKDFLANAGNSGANGTIAYGDNDTTAGMTNAAGGLITSGAKVAAAMYTAGLSVTDPIGIMRYSALMAPGTDPSDPSTFWRHQYDTGGARAFSRWAYIQVPIVETNVREEAIVKDSRDYRIALYPDTAGVTFYVAGVAATGMVQVANMSKLTMLTGAAASGTPTQYCVTGRTYFFNTVAPTSFSVRYTPKLDLPFCSLKSAGATGVITSANEWGMAKYIGKTVSYDTDSNFILSSGGDNLIGRILDVKEGSSKDLALVRTYYRDMGLWQEQPGSATDGRNAILSIANAPRYIARIAVQFNIPMFT
jgi:hypothetical protein